MVAAFDHIDGVDLHIAQMLHGRVRCLGPVAERRASIESLGAQPDAFRLGFGERVGLPARGDIGRSGATDVTKFSDHIYSILGTFFRAVRWLPNRRGAITPELGGEGDMLRTRLPPCLMIARQADL